MAGEGSSVGDAVEPVGGETAHVSSSRSQASPWGMFSGVAAAALTVAISPAVASKTFTPKYAILLLVAAVGIVPFMSSLRRSRQALASWAALAFLAVGLISALTSVAPSVSVFGLYLWGTGWLMWLGCLGAFGIGLRLQRQDLDWLVGGLVVGAIANSLLALYQTLAVPTSATFGPYQANQADGFLGNPIHLEALLLGVIAVVAVRATRSMRVLGRWAPALVLMAVALEFTTERLAIILLPVLMIGLVIYRRREGLVASLAIAGGYAIGYLGGGSNLGSRVSQGTASPGFGLRIDIWKVAAHALLHHLLIGVGPGLFEAGATPLLTRQLALGLGPGRLFADAHNILVEVALTTGVLGLGCLAVWVLAALVRARNPLFLFALAVLAVELVEPLNIAMTPLAFLCLGACALIKPILGAPAPPPSNRVLLPPFARAVLSLLVVLAFALGTTMLAGDVAFTKSPPRGYFLSDARRANQLMPYWPNPADSLATLYQYRAAVSHRVSVQRRDLERARTDLITASRRAPFDPSEWLVLGNVYRDLGELSLADSSYARALRDDPWSADALQGMALVATSRRQWATAARWYRSELSVLPSLERGPIRASLRTVLKHR
ncbi:MAG: O-antigen ligase family protein [Acidimicrobiales bacterium]